MIRFDVEEIEAPLAFLKKLNSFPLEEIEFYEGGEKVEIDPRVLDHWRFVGLVNKSFIELGCHRMSWEDWINNGKEDS